jgi:hypothetical protein
VLCSAHERPHCSARTSVSMHSCMFMQAGECMRRSNKRTRLNVERLVFAGRALLNRRIPEPFCDTCAFAGQGQLQGMEPHDEPTGT